MTLLPLDKKTTEIFALFLITVRRFQEQRTSRKIRPSQKCRIKKDNF